jgi:iron(III) transport system ATP-binding protein
MAHMTETPREAPATVLLNRLSKHFKSPEGGVVKAVDDITIELEGGTFVTLLGPSGCGKTTTLRMIAGFETPTTGRIMVDDRDIARLTPDKRGMGMVFQSYALFPHLTVHDNIAFGVQLQGKKGQELEDTIQNALDLVNLHGLGKRKIAELSGGQQQRVALARAMAIEPRVLLFDEPLSNLDAKLRVSLRSEIRRIQQRLGTTSVYVTHDQAEAMALSDVVVVMNAGKIEQAGPPDVIYRRPNTRFVADFIGRANFLSAKVKAVGNDTVDVELLGVSMSIPAGEGHQVGETATVVARPESINVGSGALRAAVKDNTFLGSYVEYELDIGGDQEPMLAIDGEWMSRGLHAPGADIAWELLPERAYVLPPQEAIESDQDESSSE